MHIVFVTTELATKNNPTGGLGTFIANIARIFTTKGHKVQILVVSTKNQIIEFDENVNIENIFIPMNEWEKINKMAQMASDGNNVIWLRRYTNIIYKAQKVSEKIKEIDNKEKIDIVHYSNHGCLSLFADTKIPYVVRISGFLNICHGAENRFWNIDSEQNAESWSDKMEHEVLRTARHIISPSMLLKGIGENKFGLKNVEVIESPFVLNESNWDYSIFEEKCKGKKYIIHYGTLSYLKGTQIIAEIAEEFLKNHSDMYIVLAGKNKSMEDEEGQVLDAFELVRKYSKSYGSRVIYAGTISREQLYPIIENAEICVLPSRIENLSNACIEAMAMGKIVVATNGASYEQLIEDKVNGFLCECDNAGSFLQGIEEAISLNGEQRHKISQKAIKTVEKLNPEIIYKQYLEYYQNVIKEWNIGDK